MDDESDNEIKMILLGDCGVGKTNIISRYLRNEFREDQMSTSGANYAMKKKVIDGNLFRINIWDTAGQEQYRSVTKMFLQDAQILLLCYSIVDHKSFEHLDYWYRLATEIIGTDIVLGVAGNKSDLYETEQVKDSEGQEFANKYNAEFKLVSAKTNKEGIDFLFDKLIENYVNMKNGVNNPKSKYIKLENEKNNENDDNNQTNKNNKKNKRNCC